MNSITIGGDATTYRLDAEHGALRLTVLMSFIVACIGFYLILGALIASDGLNIIAILGALFGGYGVSFVLERTLKGRWHSGRVVEVSNHGTIRQTNNGAVEHEFYPADDTTLLLWRFEISKRARVPKGWSMMAVALERGGEYLPLYTFMSPDQVSAFDPQGQFRRLRGKKETSTPTVNPLRDDLRLAGEDRRLNDAETARWMSGAEMTREDFAAYVASVRVQYVNGVSA
ncbi:MAG: hypothetical protein SGI73_19875 [Chloroflexota bacterium]|nr:hypothetical protein [Chloroflexota bacterium]